MQQRTLYKRKRKLIRHDLQLKVVFITLFVASLVLLLHFQLSLAALWGLSSAVTTTSSVTEVCDQMREALIDEFIVSIAMAIPLAAAVGILYSFKFCGPIYKFKKYFTELRGGNWNERCHLRKGDDLQDVCEAINTTLDEIRGFLHENRKTVEATRALVASGGLHASSGAASEVKALEERLRDISRQFNERMPLGRERQTAAPPGSGGAAGTPASTPAESAEAKGEVENVPEIQGVAG
jgi:methyl-accepting chemotaxis protein